MNVESEELSQIIMETHKLKKELNALFEYLSEMEIFQMSINMIDSAFINIIRFLPRICSPFIYENIMNYLCKERKSTDGEFRKYIEYYESAVNNYNQIKAMLQGVNRNFVCRDLLNLVNKTRSHYKDMYEIKKKIFAVRSSVKSKYYTHRKSFTDLRSEIGEFIIYFEDMERAKNCITTICESVLGNLESLQRKHNIPPGFQNRLLPMMKEVESTFEKYQFYLRIFVPDPKNLEAALKEEFDKNVYYLLWCLPLGTKLEYYDSMRQFREEFLMSIKKFEKILRRSREEKLYSYSEL